jgi:Putative restriction endonuclease
VNGELAEVPFESDLNNLIAVCLLAEFFRFVPVRLLRRGTEIVVNSYRTTTRIPDLMVLTKDLATSLTGAKRSVVMPDMPPPALVVEIVSPGTANEARDYRALDPAQVLQAGASELVPIAIGRFNLQREKGDTQKPGFFGRRSRLSLQVASRNPVSLLHLAKLGW